MSKKLICLALLLMLVVTAAFAEQPSRTAEDIPVLVIAGDVTTAPVEETVAAEAVAAAVEAVTQGAEGMSDEAKAAAEAVGVDLTKVDFEAAVVVKPVLMTMTTASTVTYTVPAGLEDKAITAFACVNADLWPLKTTVTEAGVEVAFTAEDAAVVNGQVVTMTFAPVEE